MPKPSYSNEDAANRLLDWNHATLDELDARKWGSADLGTGATVTYSYVNFFQTIDANGDGLERRLTLAEIEAVERHIQLIEDIADIDLQRVGTGYSDDGDLKIQKRLSGTGNTPPSWSDRPGDADLLEPAAVTFADPNPLGSFPQRHALHEILHGLGLNHPGPYDGSGFNYADDAIYLEDTNQYSIMSYWNGSITGASYGRPGGLTLMLHDVVALQKLYGANETAFSGNTIYGFNSNTDRDPWTVDDANDNMFGAIWDTGGEDLIDASGYSDDSEIDLRESHFSSLNGERFNLSIAPGAVIENAFGGFGDDTLTGNAAGNVLIGNGGNDDLWGRDGNDTLLGSGGADFVSGGRGVDLMRGGSGVDTVSYEYSNGGWRIDLATEEARSLSGPTVEVIDDFENAYGSDGDDVIRGDDGANVLTGERGHDRIFGFGGGDLLLGNGGRDLISGGLGDDTMNGGGGNDTVDYTYSSDAWTIRLATHTADLNGQATVETIIGFENVNGAQGNDRIYGDGRDNRLEGERGNDLIYGDNGDDTLHGERGNDTLRGGGGVDDMDGGPGRDTLDYAYSGGGWTIDLDAESATSSGGTTETVRRFENVFGSQGADLVSGTDTANDLEGERGHDTLMGRGGNDTLEGERGEDELHGNEGNDDLLGGLGRDFLFGGTGNDVIDGGAGNDVLRGGSGNDVFRYTSLDDSTTDAPDLLVDGNSGIAFSLRFDLFDVSAIDADATRRGNQSFTFGSDDRGGLTVIDFLGTSVVVANVDNDADFELFIGIEDGTRSASAYHADHFIL